ncbi:MAG: IS30 family transposase [Oleiphilaceae bacterium]|jgi:IS30 family transposase
MNHNGGYSRYRATKANQAAWDRALSLKLCKLGGNKNLSRIIATKLQRKWSPEQISGWLKRSNPQYEYNYVSHETIYSNSRRFKKIEGLDKSRMR